MDHIQTLYSCQVSCVFYGSESRVQNFIFEPVLFSIRFQDITVDQFRDIRAKAGGLIILLPDNLSRLSAEQRQVRSLCCPYDDNT